ncbi:hypothetical protein FRZ06_10000 [Anoxybacterium hadale]|uniref:Uncharacterized protein n=1 Tax=Anoxybacterium hadale TaxID=3408580 RepID=A0ACD1ABN3_9FIRM|nr:hypothetical protein FRZ06_10000 [Clostridiales bacterium]
MKVILNNGAELDAILVNGQTRYFQGANRDSLEFQFSKDAVAFDHLDTLFIEPENTKRITLQQGEKTYLHENYTLRVSMGLAPVVITPATGTEPEVIEERYSVVMAQKTYAELLLEAMQETVDILVMESLGV